MKVKLAKWGNSLAVRIPSPVAIEAALAPGASFDIGYSGGSLHLTPVISEPSLDELLEGITPQNRHEETDWGSPVGKEIW